MKGQSTRRIAGPGGGHLVENVRRIVAKEGFAVINLTNIVPVYQTVTNLRARFQALGFSVVVDRSRNSAVFRPYRAADREHWTQVPGGAVCTTCRYPCAEHPQPEFGLYVLCNGKTVKA